MGASSVSRGCVGLDHSGLLRDAFAHPHLRRSRFSLDAQDVADLLQVICIRLLNLLERGRVIEDTEGRRAPAGGRRAVGGNAAAPVQQVNDQVAE